jgi:hypothetical protein
MGDYLLTSIQMEAAHPLAGVSEELAAESLYDKIIRSSKAGLDHHLGYFIPVA